MTEKTGKRDSLFIVSLCLFALLLANAFYHLPQAEAAGKALLQQSDFKYIGAFNLPFTLPSGCDPTFGKGLALRYVNGELHAFNTGWKGGDCNIGIESLYEVKVPTPATNLNQLPTATLVREWGDVWHGKRTNTGGNSEVLGLYWDETDKRLYWTYGDAYPPGSGGDDPSVAYSTLNDGTGTSTAYGPWNFPGRGYKATQGCVVSIPSWFADAYTGGKRLAAGCGGYFSIMTTGPDSMGPAISAFSPPGTSGGSVPFVNLVGYPFSNSPVDCNARAQRDTDYTDDFDGCNPTGGVGHWTWADYINQGGVWADTADKSGLLFFPNIGNGRVWYETSTLHAQRSSIWWFVYDPADLAKVALGQVSQSSIQPKSKWNANFPGLGSSLPGWSDGPGNMVFGVAFDSSTKRLYIGVLWSAVYVYEVQSSSTSDTTASAAPGRLRTN
jgi:hypothetical protein